MVKIFSLSTILLATAMNLVLVISASPVEQRQVEPPAAVLANPGDVPDPVKFSNTTRSLLPGIGAVLNGYHGTELNAVHQLREGICEFFPSSSAEWSYKKNANQRIQVYEGSSSFCDCNGPAAFLPDKCTLYSIPDPYWCVMLV